VTRLTEQPWLEAAPTLAVMDALDAAGGAGCARFVGGCVRNALLGQPVDDVDIATTLEPPQVVAALEAAGLKAVPTGVAHGTITGVAERRPFEITTLRRDVSTDGRNATVAFTTSWEEDAARRDFRLNALYADRAGEVFDPTGQGAADCTAGRIVFVGDPETRIREDYLRILRFFRFHAWYGRGEPDVAGLEACRALASGMARLSAERISRELLKLLAAADPVPAVRAMADSGVLHQVLPDGADPDALEAMAALTRDPELRLSVLLPDDPTAVDAALRRLRFANAARERLVETVREPLPLDATDQQVRAAAYRAGVQAARDRLLRAAAKAGGGADPVRERLAVLDGWAAPRLPIGGKDIAALGVSPGPETGRLLKAFEDSWIADDFPAEGHQARLEALFSAGRG